MNNASNLYLYQREGGYLPRVAAVHDLCGYGKCSLGIAIPVLSAAGIDVCPVPTSLFSAHTRFPKFYMHDTTPMLGDYLDAWREEGIELDGIYSGFLGSAEQVDAILRLYREYPRALRIVDPVMGDGGAKYPTYTDEMCEAMKGLVDGADVLTPNLTEASIITGIPYESQDVDEKYVRRMMDALLRWAPSRWCSRAWSTRASRSSETPGGGAAGGGWRGQRAALRTCFTAPATSLPRASPQRSTPGGACTTPWSLPASSCATPCASRPISRLPGPRREL